MMIQREVCRRVFLKGSASGLAAVSIRHTSGGAVTPRKLAICWSGFQKFPEQTASGDLGRFTFFVTSAEASRFQSQLQQLQQAGHLLGFRPKSHNYQAELAAWRASLPSKRDPPYILGNRPTKKLAQFCAKLALSLAVWQQKNAELDLSNNTTPQLLGAASYAQTCTTLAEQRLTSVTLAAIDRRAIEL